MTDQEPIPPQSAPEESLKVEASAPETLENVAPVEPEEEVDLNQLFPDEDTDLNELFPEPEMRSLLKKVQRNAKDLSKMKSRFSDTFQEQDSD